MKKTIVIIVATLSLTCCARETRVKDIKAVTNPEATHVWLVQSGAENDFIIYCDSNWHGQEQIVCVKPSGQ